MSKVLKVTVGDGVALQIAKLAEGEEIAEAEIVRRAVWLYLGQHSAPSWPSSGPSPASLGPERREEARRTPPAPRPAPAAAPDLTLFPAPVVPPKPALLVFPCVRGRLSDSTSWGLTSEQLEQWEETYPDMDVLGEARKALAYLTAKKDLKTASGMPTFLCRWFNRAQDGGRYLRRQTRRAGRPEATLMDTYGYDSWAEWEADLRNHLTDDELAEELGKLAATRRTWEASHGAV